MLSLSIAAHLGDRRSLITNPFRPPKTEVKSQKSKVKSQKTEDETQPESHTARTSANQRELERRVGVIGNLLAGFVDLVKRVQPKSASAGHRLIKMGR